MIRGVLFDYGNTLVQIKEEGTVLREILAELGHEVDADIASKGMEASEQYWNENYRGYSRGGRWTEVIRLDCGKHALSMMGLGDDADSLAGEVVRRWTSYEKRGPYDDVKPTLTVLESMGFKLGVLSQNRLTGAELKQDLETREIARYFSTVLTSEDAGYDKPDSGFFEAGLKMMGLKNTELLYVGNRYHEDVLGARNAGITPVLVERRPRHKIRDCLSITDLTSLIPMMKESETSFKRSPVREDATGMTSCAKPMNTSTATQES